MCDLEQKKFTKGQEVSEAGISKRQGFQIKIFEWEVEKISPSLMVIKIFIPHQPHLEVIVASLANIFGTPRASSAHMAKI
jgi:hypothetical protein